MRVAACLFFLLIPMVAGRAQIPAFKAKAEHVVLCVWDGMRPDFVTPERTPTLYRLAQSGTFFANNHSFYVTTTEVNGTILATGAFPRRNGIIANREYRPAINLMKPVATEDALTIRIGDALEAGRYLDAVTVAEIVQQAGFRTAVAGAKPIGLLHDRNFNRAGKNGSIVLFAGKTYPPSYLTTITAALGKWPEPPKTEVTLEETRPNTAQNVWTTRALTELLWNDGVPKYTVLWLGDPDFSQHLTAPGHSTALAAIADSDANLATVLKALELKGVRDKTDIFVVSDHGFSTVHKTVDLVATFKRAGIAATREFKMTPKRDEVLVVNVGGSTALYVMGKSPAVVARCVDVLQMSEFAGPIFTTKALPGTFTFAQARLDSNHAPDVLFAFRSLPGKNQYGIPGLIWGEGKRPGFGTHGTFARAEIQNTLIAAGPDIRAGFRCEVPTGNIDVAPTILHLLGLAPPKPMDGRILSEALVSSADVASAAFATKRGEVTRRMSGKTWRQWIDYTIYRERVYFEEGNAVRE